MKLVALTLIVASAANLASIVHGSCVSIPLDVWKENLKANDALFIQRFEDMDHLKGSVNVKFLSAINATDYKDTDEGFLKIMIGMGKVNLKKLWKEIEDPDKADLKDLNKALKDMRQLEMKILHDSNISTFDLVAAACTDDSAVYPDDGKATCRWSKNGKGVVLSSSNASPKEGRLPFSCTCDSVAGKGTVKSHDIMKEFYTCLSRN